MSVKPRYYDQTRRRSTRKVCRICKRPVSKTPGDVGICKRCIKTALEDQRGK